MIEFFRCKYEVGLSKIIMLTYFNLKLDDSDNLHF